VAAVEEGLGDGGDESDAAFVGGGFGRDANYHVGSPPSGRLGVVRPVLP
jgi:hypothetical protein